MCHADRLISASNATYQGVFKTPRRMGVFV